jgi:N-dimethylarginine dimethylaminohydrolase
MEKGYELITVTDREDRMFGANLVAIGDRKVLSYVWNRRIMRELERRGFDVIGVEGYELVKGGGGLHCMILPIERESIKI